MEYLKYKEHRQQGTFNFPIAFYHIAPSHPRYHMPYHWHAEWEIIRILEGSFNMTLDGKPYAFKRNDIILIQDGTLHGGIPNDSIYECIVFDMRLLLKDNHVCTELVQGIMQHTISIHQQLPCNIPELIYVISALFAAMSEKKTGYEFVTQGMLYQLLGIILGKKLYDNSISGSNTSTRNLLLLKEVLQYIENNYSKPVSLAELSVIAGMSPKYFCRFFYKMVNRTPIDYLNYYRTECACRQLAAGNVPITEVGLNCGFNDTSYFIKIFHRYKGITPKQYVKNRL